MDIALITYNNGFNRIVKRLNTFSEYKNANYENTHDDILDFTDVNFNPNDGLTTEIVIGTSKDLDWIDNGPDYAVLHEDDTVISRWFITGIKRERQGQYRIALKRDVLAEYRENVLEAPCYVEKGTIRDVTDPLLFNAEGVSFNQIKKSQIPLKDQTGMAWIVGYMAKNIDSAADKTISYTFPDSIPGAYTDSQIDFGDCITYKDSSGATVDQASKEAVFVFRPFSYFKMRAIAPCTSQSYTGNTVINLKMSLSSERRETSFQFNQIDWEGLNSITMDILPRTNNKFIRYADYESWVEGWVDYMNGSNERVALAFKNLLNNTIQDAIGASNYLSDENLEKYNEKVVIHNGVPYQLLVKNTEYYNQDAYLTGQNANLRALCQLLEESKIIDNVTWDSYEDVNENTKNKAKITIRCKKYEIIAQEIHTDDSLSFTLPTISDRNTCENAQYDMFAMPVTAAGLGFTVDGDDMGDTDFQRTITVDNDDVTQHTYVNAISRNQLLISQLLATKLGDYIYDVQLLPYCPIDFVYFNGYNYTTYQFLEGDTNQCVLDNMDDKDYSVITTNGGDVMGIIFWPKNPMFSKYIELNLPNEYESREQKTIPNPTLTYNNSNHSGDPIWRLEFPYRATGTLSTSDVVLPTQIEANWMTLSYNGSNGHPCLYLTSDQLPQDPTPSQQQTLANMEISLTATWVLPDTAERIKIQNECEFQRLVSPNFNGMFEFKKCKMEGGVHNINVDCLYKPYQPYIKLNPDFSFLYGQDFNDSTGLILGGDFSLPKMKDAFTEYELQNKNYQAIFSRSIQNLDVNNEIAKERHQLAGVMGTAVAASHGLKDGAKKGGLPGALIGAGMEGGLAAFAAVKDLEFLDRSQREARDFAIDNFNYQLGNIKALPQSITKSTPLTYNNTVWPILEEYDATDEEKELLKNKLRYDGMTIMKVAKLSDYEAEGGYLKGKLIRLDIDANSQVANQIYQEVDRGFYTE